MGNKTKSQQILPVHEAIIDRALHDIFGDTSWQLKKHFAQGASAAIYVITCKQKTLVARISDPNRPGANIPLEYTCMQQASDCKVAPHLYYCNEQENLSIMDYIDSKPLSFFQRAKKQDVADLGKSIAKLHGSEFFPASHSSFDMIEMIGNGMKQAFLGDSYIRNCLDIVAQYQSILNVDKDKRPSHRDLHGFNLLHDGEKYYFIDWEGAGNESLYFDLAVVCNTMLFEHSELVNTLLTAYFNQSPTAEQLAKFELMRVIAFIYYGLVLMFLSTSVPEFRLSADEIVKLPDYTHYIRQQIANNQSDLTGSYLQFAYSMLTRAMQCNKSEAVQQSYALLCSQTESHSFRK